MGQGAWPAVSYPIGLGAPARVPVPAVRHARAAHASGSIATPKTAPIVRVTFISDAAVLTRAAS